MLNIYRFYPIKHLGLLVNPIRPKQYLSTVAPSPPKMAPLKLESTEKSFGGLQKVFSHYSEELKCDMKFAVYEPPQMEQAPVPVVYWLSGLTCSEQNFITKAGGQQHAARLGLCVVCPDTSPRGCGIEGEDESWDFGSGAGFYVDATEPKWAANYRMFSYVTKELPALVKEHFNVSAKSGVMGHSMGGHGALVSALKCPGAYQSVSAFAPICHPSNCPWGVKAFTGYLGADQAAWKAYDSCELVKTYNGPPLHVLVDQGSADKFYVEKQLLPEDLVAASAGNRGVTVALRLQEGYSHSYYFIASFVQDHLEHHAKYLLA